MSICKLKLPYGNRSKKRLSSPHKLGYPILINTQRVPLIMDHRLYSDTHPIVSHSISYDMLEFKTRSMDDIITIFGFTMYVCIYIINIYIYVSLYIPNLPRLGHVSTPSVPASASSRVFPISCNASARAAAASAARSAAWSGWGSVPGSMGK